MTSPQPVSSSCSAEPAQQQRLCNNCFQPVPANGPFEFYCVNSQCGAAFKPAAAKQVRAAVNRLVAQVEKAAAAEERSAQRALEKAQRDEAPKRKRQRQPPSSQKKQPGALQWCTMPPRSMPASVLDTCSNHSTMQLQSAAFQSPTAPGPTQASPRTSLDSSATQAAAAKAAAARIRALQEAEAAAARAAAELRAEREQAEAAAREQAAAREREDEREREALEAERRERKARRPVRVRMRGLPDVARIPDDELELPPPPHLGCRVYRRAISRALCERDVGELAERAVVAGEAIRALQPDSSRCQVDLTYKDEIARRLRAVLKAKGELEGRRPVEWRALHSKAGCKRQGLHFDYNWDLVRGLSRKPASVILALQDGARLWVRDEEARAQREVVLRAGDVLVFDGDVAHSGAAYLCPNTRVHVYLDVPSVERDTDYVWKAALA
jgi:hypothetical protein